MVYSWLQLIMKKYISNYNQELRFTIKVQVEPQF